MSDTAAGSECAEAHSLDPALEGLLLELVDDWMAGTPHPLRAYLDRRPGLADRPEVLVELINQEVILRQMRGETPCPADYLPDFPEVTESLHRLFEVLALASGTPGLTVDTMVQSPPIGPSMPRRNGSSPPEIPGYEIESFLGRGGMSIVYLARHHGLNRRVALKLLQESSQDEPALAARFRREAEAVARCQHPNLVQIHDVGEHAGELYLALEYVPGGHLGRALAGKPQPPRRAAEVIEILARAIDHAHAQGVVHRDLKPANVLLARDGQPKITDFGLAKLKDSSTQTEVGTVLGTLAYMAPEQAQGRSADVGPRTDIHALGAILYEALTGRPPYRAETPQRILHAILNEEVIPPSGRQTDIPRDLEAVCLKCLEKEPTRRYATAADLAEDLRRFLDGQPTRARQASAAERCLRWCRRNRTAVATIAALLLLTTISAWQAVRATMAERRSRAERSRAEKEAEAASEVIRFFQEIIGQVAASSQAEQGRKPDPDIRHRTVLDRAAELIGERFSRRPLSEAAIRLAIGEGYLELGLFKEARPHLERALELRRIELGADDHQTLVAMGRLGTLFLGDDKLDDARRFLVPAMEGLRSSRGLTDLETLIAMKTTGALYLNQSKIPEAMTLLARTVEGLRAACGPEHPETLDATTCLAIGYSMQGHPERAEKELEDTIHRLEASSGPEHPDALDAKTHLATVYYAIGRPGEAIRVLKDVLQVQRRVLKVGHPATLKTMAWLGHTYVMTRDFAGAEPLLLEALTECRKALDPNHSTIELVLASLSGMYAVKAKENKADPNLNGEYLRRTGEYLMEAAEINRLRHGPDDDLTDMANTAVLSFYRKTEHEDAAEPYAREHLEFCIRKKPDSADRYVAEANLGLCRLGRKAYSEAERSLLLAHEWITSRSHLVPPETLGQLGGIEERVIEFYQKDGKTKQADAWKLRRTNLGFPAKPSAPK